MVDENFNLDHLSLMNLVTYAKDLGYLNVNKIWFPGKSTGDFIQLVDDSKVGEIGNSLHNGGILNVYIDAIRTEREEREVTKIYNDIEGQSAEVRKIMHLIVNLLIMMRMKKIVKKMKLTLSIMTVMMLEIT